ncbi:hypothetical protein K504DRAFT_105312 [Pleomassaria siparia CBS 279.74]|uniref:Uncharacterized protein n=1 Tax=Pleomassaria siparia CBS 279.74 TaxID=1314801 RepID=A0A6G1JXE4_9PLEO|nr:hypothetical protein K504DRAFT_105312 [Pleomassaria siparia CBS 279.74]
MSTTQSSTALDTRNDNNNNNNSSSSSSNNRQSLVACGPKHREFLSFSPKRTKSKS